MPTHWTYKQFGNDDDLSQGDILSPTEDLRAILKEVHPHFLDPKYVAFLVTTQSCDLVRRDSAECSARYINLTVVRQLEDVLHDLLSHVCQPVASRIYLQETKGEANRLMQRVFNQNEQSLGLFYLHPDGDAGIVLPSVALLRVNVTLRAEHYDALTRSRVGKLGSEFTAKLGWLVGNLFSRVGTADWSETKDLEAQLKKLVEETLDAAGSQKSPRWVKRSWVDAAKENGVDFGAISGDQLMAEIEKHKPPTAREAAINHAIRVVKEVVPQISEEELTKLSNRLGNDRLFAKAIRSAKTE